MASNTDEARGGQSGDGVGDRVRRQDVVLAHVLERQLAHVAAAVEPLPNEETERREAVVSQSLRIFENRRRFPLRARAPLDQNTGLGPHRPLAQPKQIRHARSSRGSCSIASTTASRLYDQQL